MIALALAATVMLGADHPTVVRHDGRVCALRLTAPDEITESCRIETPQLQLAQRQLDEARANTVSSGWFAPAIVSLSVGALAAGGGLMTRTAATPMRIFTSMAAVTLHA